MKKTILFVSAFFLLKLSASAQEITIPDSAFKYLLIELKIDKNEDGKIQVEEAAPVTHLDLSHHGLTNLTGIEAFTNLDTLNITVNKLSSLDLSKNVKLTALFASINKLTRLDLPANTQLEYLFCSNNLFSQLDLTSLSHLKMLDASFNKLETLDLSSLPFLTLLECYSNRLSSLDLSFNKGLKKIYCDNNRLKTLDLSANPLVETLNCSYNFLTSLNLTQCTPLTALSCYSNQLAELDVRGNKNLLTMDVGFNPFASLDLSLNTQLTSLDCAQSVNLKYVCVANVAAVSSNPSFFKDAATQWTDNCMLLSVKEEDFGEATIFLSPNPSSDAFQLTLSQPAHVSIYTSSGMELESFGPVQHKAFGQNYVAGVYYVSIQTENKKERRRIVKW